MRVASHLLQSTRGCGPCGPGDGQPPPSGSPLLDLAPRGGYLAASITACAGGLLHHLFTLTSLFPLPQIHEIWGRREGVAVIFCGPFRQVAPSRVLPGTLPYGVRTFLRCIVPCDHPADLGHSSYHIFFISIMAGTLPGQ